jgi:phage tail-like protein
MLGNAPASKWRLDSQEEYQMPKREEPLVGFHFALEIGGLVIGNFNECSGLGSEHEVIEYRDANEPAQTIIKMPGRLKWDNIVLKRGITSSMDIWDWRQKLIDGDLAGARQDGSIVMYDRRRKEVARWNFRRGWPAKISGPQPAADSNEIGIEELTIVHEYIKRVS